MRRYPFRPTASTTTMADVHVLDVLLHGEPVGTIARLDGDRTLFGFRDAYVQDAERPVLGLGFTDRFGEPITSFRPTRTRLLPYFSNLLPEGRLRTYLAERAGVHPEREFFLLRVLGRDLPGAVTTRPPTGDVSPSEVHDASGPPVGEGGRQRQALRFSLAGVQLKFSAVQTARGGLTIPAEGTGGSPEPAPPAAGPDTSAPSSSGARETVALFRQHWRAEKYNLPLAANVVAAIEAHLTAVPLYGADSYGSKR